MQVRCVHNFFTIAFIALTIAMLLIFHLMQTMDMPMGLPGLRGMCMSLENEQDHHYEHKHCRKHVNFHKHGLGYAEEVNG